MGNPDAALSSHGNGDGLRLLEAGRETLQVAKIIKKNEWKKKTVWHFGVMVLWKHRRIQLFPKI